MSDEPPDYIDWGNNRSGWTIFGCLAAGVGLLFVLTGGLCAFLGVAGADSDQLWIGVVLVLIGLALVKAGL